MTALRDRRCVPCGGGVPALTDPDVRRLLAEIPAWAVEDGKLRRRFAFADFPRAIAFVNAIAAIAEAEDHHPDFCVHYRQVDVTIWTHAVAGLTENDFILAAKIDEAAAGA